MADLPILGGGSSVYQVDAISDFGLGAEGSAVTFKARTKAFVVPANAGDAVFRRAYMTIVHKDGFSFSATPVVDFKKLGDLKTHFSRAASRDGKEERVSLLLPLARDHSDFPNIKLGVRGTTFQMEIEASSPGAEWHVESLVIAYDPGHQARGKTTSE